MDIYTRNFLKISFLKTYKELPRLITQFKRKPNIFFLIGIFFLASAPAISTIFFIIALISSGLKNKLSFLNDSFNYPFLIIGIYLILGSFFHFFNPYLRSLDIRHLSLIGILNWLPFFWIYWNFEIYLSSYRKPILRNIHQQDGKMIQ